mmetsp:Transcript_13991/g.44442  ORF Transcript_13991/g.44442 Transcript_13991/m.44442 type:complete len:251 (-) Transcript_13991:1548-2300(-)
MSRIFAREGHSGAASLWTCRARPLAMSCSSGDCSPTATSCPSLELGEYWSLRGPADRGLEEPPPRGADIARLLARTRTQLLPRATRLSRPLGTRGEEGWVDRTTLQETARLYYDRARGNSGSVAQKVSHGPAGKGRASLSPASLRHNPAPTCPCPSPVRPSPGRRPLAAYLTRPRGGGMPRMPSHAVPLQHTVRSRLGSGGPRARAAGQPSSSRCSSLRGAATQRPLTRATMTCAMSRSATGCSGRMLES